MSWQAIFTAMLPEHILLAGIVVLIGLEIASQTRASFLVSVCVVIAATVAAVSLAATGYAMAPFPDQFSVAPDALLAKAVVLALAIPVLLISRDDFADAQFHILIIGSLYGVCLLLSADSFLILFLGIELMSLPVYVLVLARVPAHGKRRGGAQVPCAGRNSHGHAIDGRCSAVWRERIAFARRICRGTELARPDGHSGGGARHRGLFSQGSDRAVPHLGAGRLRGRHRSSDRLHGNHRESGRSAGRRAPVRHGKRAAADWQTCSRSCPWPLSSGATWPRCASRAFAG